MSISNPKIQNPCKKFIDFKSDKGQFFFYDKEKEEKIELVAPFYFVVLDELATISGYNKKNDCGIYSNEVHRTTDEILRVKTFKGFESITGLYNDIKDSVKAMGGKYTKSVYALLVNQDKSTELINIKFKGAAFSAWLDKKIHIDTSIISVSEFKQESNGNTNYMVPIFKGFKMEEEVYRQAIKMDSVLQEYLKEYKAQQPEKEIAKADTIEEPLKDNQGEWVGKKEFGAMSDINDLPGNDNEDDLPF